MEWSLHAVEHFDEYASDWSRIAQSRYADHPFLDLRFVRSSVTHFGSPNLRLAIGKSDGQVAGLALVAKKNTVVMETFAPSQVPFSMFVIGDAGDLSEQISAMPRQLSAFTCLFGVMHFDPRYCGGHVKRSALIDVLPYAITMSIDVTGDFEDYWAGRKKKLRDNISRYFRRVENDAIEWRLEELIDRGDMANAVSRYGEMESAGWKGERGSAISEENVQGRFYNELLEAFSETGEARVFNLYFDNRMVSSRLAVIRNGILVFLKTTYDEAFGRYAPGRLLLYLVLKKLSTDPGVTTAEFYTNANADQLQWATDQRETFHLNVFSSTLRRKFLGLVRRRK